MPYALSLNKKKRDDLGEVGNCACPSTCHRFGLWAAAVIHGSGLGLALAGGTYGVRQAPDRA